MSDSEMIRVELTREQWQALLKAVPADAMTYTPEGVLVFEAYQAITHAVTPAASA